jgi:hypothetical protein
LTEVEVENRGILDLNNKRIQIKNTRMLVSVLEKTVNNADEEEIFNELIREYGRDIEKK